MKQFSEHVVESEAEPPWTDVRISYENRVEYVFHGYQCPRRPRPASTSFEFCHFEGVSKTEKTKISPFGRNDRRTVEFCHFEVHHFCHFEQSEKSFLVIQACQDFSHPFEMTEGWSKRQTATVIQRSH